MSAVYDAARVSITIDGVELGTAPRDAVPWSDATLRYTGALWTPAPGGVLEQIAALAEPDPPRRAAGFDARLEMLARKHAAERVVIREWLRRSWSPRCVAAWGGAPAAMTPARPALAAVLSALDGVHGPEAFEVLHARGLWPDPAGPDQPPLITSPYASRHGSLADVASLGLETLATITALLREAIERARPKPDVVNVVWRVEPFDPHGAAVLEQVVQSAPLVEILRLGVGVSWGHGADINGVSIFAAVLVPPIEEPANASR